MVQELHKNSSTRTPKISFIKNHEHARLPERNHKELLIGDTGYDIYSIEDVLIPAHSTKKVPVGLEIGHIEEGYWIRIESRSGLYFKHGLTAFNGVIDNSYTGELGISMINNSDVSYQVKKGDRIAQLVIYSLIEPEITWGVCKKESQRGDKGFGSSGR